MSAAAPLLPGQATLGVLGGGQLGRMFVHAAQSLGYGVVVLDPDADSPAGQAAQVHLCEPYLSAAGLQAMARSCHAVTTEFENVPSTALEALAIELPVSPAASAVRVCQDRALEKAHFLAQDVPCAPWARIESPADLQAAQRGTVEPGEARPGFPALLKTARLGYDGKGQVAVVRAEELPAAWEALGRVPCVLEQRLPLRHELSVIVARGRDGTMVQLPVQQNLHHQGILALTEVPAPQVDEAQAAQAGQWARALAQGMGYVGVLCVEFFVLDDGRLVANEMAPRPHNSGHHSIDACDVSQFELQVRCMAGLPLTPPRLHSPCVMLNLLGDLWFAAADANAACEPDWAAVLALPGVHLHLYGKKQARRGRKMGHLTVTAATAAQARGVAREAARCLGLGAALGAWMDGP